MRIFRRAYYIAVCAKRKLYSSVNADKMNDNIPDEAANVFLEISPHPVLAKSIRECCKLTNQQQSLPLILPTLKRKENEQITLLTYCFIYIFVSL
ncbi:unnamed protein product [Adineta steineri]|uniref:Uncharacterized protein n=1 Tax=Adineta steineri TaxID=433720 RepID=A0A814NHU3_9BILA|nr:unnamed protein product [Adineta steineri]